ncbi:MAG: citramalate synthase [Euryarchaeota archaeon]|nr:citramalate synthase [Euryarchaeota archaeon]
MSKNLVEIYDTTLRDGSQGEGVSFTVAAKLRIAEKLDQFGIDYIEGGWPGSNPRDMAFFEEAKQLKLKHAKIVAFGSTRRASLSAEEDPQLKLLLDADTPVVTIFGKSWLLHVTEILRTTPEENLKMIEDSVRFLAEQGKQVIYDAEHFFDGYRDNSEYAIETLKAAQRGGASNLSLCDTNGGRLVEEVKAIVSEVQATLPDSSIGVHCHNDSGLGVAVSMAGIESGAVLVQGTVNGIGERNGNANLTTIIPNLILKMERLLNCSENLKDLRALSLFVDEMSNQSSNSKAPFVGISSFAHKGGVHADAAAKVKHSYEHIEPELVGNKTRVLVSDMSGRSSIMMKAKEIGFDLDARSPELKEFLSSLKEMEFKGYEYEAADASLKLLLNKYLKGEESALELIAYRVTVSDQVDLGRIVSEASVRIKVGDTVHHTVAEASGPVDALSEALNKAIAPVFPEIKDVRLRDFKVRILENKEGTDAIIRVHIESTDGESIWGTVGASDNIIAAAWEALLDSVEYKIQLSRS